MSDENKKDESKKDDSKQEPAPANQDSFNVPIEKSPWAMWALLQIPIVIIMVVVLYFLYQSRNNS